MPNDLFMGMRILESPYLLQKGTPIEVRRTWRERLFSLPWRPLAKTRTVVPMVPHSGAVRIDANTYVMHPETLRVFKGITR